MLLYYDNYLDFIILSISFDGKLKKQKNITSEKLGFN